jgi:NAD(P)-dependent dehydrogenase (short-subunit alcohol dehydrogenase family)
VRTVVITGASSGIGEAAALHLASRGVRVFAGVRRVADGAALAARAGANLTPVTLDVTSDASIAAARDAVGAAVGASGLDGLVNNAGISVAGPLEILPAAALREQFDVNFFGAIAVTQAFLPLLRAARGRVVNVSSIGGKAASPFVGAYCASKHALEAASDALRMELRPFGIFVSVIEPGRVATPIWDRSARTSSARLRALAPEALAPYEKRMTALSAFAANVKANATPPERVAEAIERALTAPTPRARYLVGIDARIQLVITRLPEPLRDRIIAAFLKTG